MSVRTGVADRRFGLSVRRLLIDIAGSVVAAALGGILGLFGFWVLRRRGVRLVGRSRLRFAAVVMAVVVLTAGFAARATVLAGVAPCQTPVDAVVSVTQPAPAPTPMRALEAVATAAPSGLAILYAKAAGADLCVSPATGVYVAARDQGFVSTVGKGALIGDVFLSWKLPQDQSPALADHEARHRLQWTVAAAIGGPLAFPAAYELVDFFFPGGRNLFERDAGLASGDYDPNTPFAPVLGPMQLAVLVMAAAGVAFLVARRMGQAAV